MAGGDDSERDPAEAANARGDSRVGRWEGKASLLLAAGSLGYWTK